MFPALFFLSLSTRSNSAGLAVVAALGSAGGVYLFVKGFRLLRFKRMILDTPLSRIHSASIGLVEVTGNPVGPYVLKAPVTGDPCYYYRVRAFQWVETGNNKHEWKSVLDESLCVPFFLEDTTGRVLVDPQGAQMDVHRSFSDEINSSVFRMSGVCPPNVRDFLAKRGLVPADKIKLEERIIPQGFPLFVFGTLGENPTENSWSAYPHKSSSLNLNAPLGFSLNISVGSFGNSPQFGVTSAAVTLPSQAAAPSSAKSSFGDFDLHPSAAISKGERHEPFAISGHSQREVVGKLAWQSTACIWGGPLLALACLYFLASFFQWAL